MPVTDGYEACEKIINICSTTNYSQLGCKVNGTQSSGNKLSVMGKNNALYRPHIVAVSSYIDDNTMNRINEAGFDDSFEIPLCTGTIESDIIPKLLERQ